MKPEDFIVEVECPQCGFELSLPFKLINNGCSLTIDYEYNPWVYCIICYDDVNVIKER